MISLEKVLNFVSASRSSRCECAAVASYEAIVDVQSHCIAKPVFDDIERFALVIKARINRSGRIRI